MVTLEKLKRPLAIGIPVLLLVLSFAEFRIADQQWQEVISSDGRGYYHYFLEQFIADDQRDLAEESDYLQSHNGRGYTKYPMGTSLLLSPFFAMGYIMAVWGDYDLTGLSYPFQLFVGLGSLFYLSLGAWMLFKLLRTFQISRGHSYLISITTVFGTNLLYYGIMGCTMSHVYSFAAIAAFGYFVRRAAQQPSAKHTLLGIIAFVLVFSIRPFNILVVLAIPLLIADIPGISTRIKQALKPAPLLVGVVLFGLSVLLQLLAWKQQTGEWILYSYSQEGFYFDRPAIGQVLFGFNKGLFVYTPMILLSFIGLFFWFRKSRVSAISFGGFFAIITYFIAAWWCWNYASGFGLRPFIDYYAIFAVPLAIGIKEGAQKFRYILYFLIPVFLALNLVQSYQYATLIMHHSSMSWEKYGYIFLKTDDKFRESLGGSSDLPPYAPSGLTSFTTYSPLDSVDQVLVDEEFVMSKDFSKIERPVNAHRMYWEISMEKKDVTPNSSEDVLVVFDFEEGGEKTYYSTFKINDTPESNVNNWTSLKHTVTTPVPGPNATVKVYLWNQRQETFYLRNYKLELYGN